MWAAARALPASRWKPCAARTRSCPVWRRIWRAARASCWWTWSIFRCRSWPGRARQARSNWRCRTASAPMWRPTCATRACRWSPWPPRSTAASAICTTPLRTARPAWAPSYSTAAWSCACASCCSPPRRSAPSPRSPWIAALAAPRISAALSRSIRACRPRISGPCASRPADCHEAIAGQLALAPGQGNARIGQCRPVSSLTSDHFMDTNTPLALLGGLTASQFMRRHWHKKPLLVRQAIPGFKPLIPRARLLAMAGEDGVESRLIQQQDGGQWKLSHGPLSRRSLPSLQKPGWTVLVQGVDLHDDGVHQLMQQFRFVPEARLDDLMISFATDQGGVGPHFDSYDVFLLQAHGRRRWRIGRQKDLSLQPDVPLKVLSNFEPEEEFVLEPELLLGLEIREHLQRHIGLQRKVLLAADAPAPAAMRLQQEDVVAVEMRAHAALVGGKADHQIVQPRLGHEAELLHQLVHAVVVQVHALHEHGPSGLLQRGQAAARQRAVAELPLATVLLLDQARLHTVLACHGQQPGAGNQGLEARDCLAHQQGLLVPVAAHELGSGKPAQQGKRCVGVHEMVRSERRDRR